MRTPGCFVASISDELYGPILAAVPAQPSPTENLECIQIIKHQTNKTTSGFNNGWDIPTQCVSTSKKIPYLVRRRSLKLLTTVL